MNCACMSVGKPGCGWVVMSTGLSSPPPCTRRPPASAATVDAGRAQLRDDRLEVLGRARPRGARRRAVIAAATANVPASMRSGMIACSIGCSSSTPSIVMIGVPAPWIRAPILLSTSASSSTSGSRAAFSITVRPFASAAAIMRFSLPVTVGMSSTIVAPRSRLRLDLDVAVLERDLGAHRLEALQVLIDRARADRAAAGQRDARAAVARDERAEHEHARAHRLDELVRRLELGLLLARSAARSRARAVVRASTVQPSMRSSFAIVAHVGELRDVLERRRARRQERRGEERQRRVLRAADRNLADQPRATFDDDLVHDVETLRELQLFGDVSTNAVGDPRHAEREFAIARGERVRRL